MTDLARISVIMPVYGPTLYLSEAIESVFQQTLPAWELIIVDDNNPDTEFRHKTRQIVSRHETMGRKITYISHDRNLNGATARNTGVAVASGDIISFLDSDDFYHPNRIATMSRILRDSSAQVGGVYSGVEFRRRGKVYSKYQSASSGNFLVETLACRFMIGTGSNLFVRREIIEELEGFDVTFSRHQDYEFLVRFFERYDMLGIDQILVVKNNENFNQPKFSRFLEIKKQFLAKYQHLIQAQSPNDQAYIMRSNYSSMGELALMEGLRQESKEMYAIASAGGPMWPRELVRRIALWIASWLR